MRKNGEVRDYELHLKRADGTRFWVFENARLMIYKGREVVVGSAADLTARKRRERELQAAREALEDAIGSLPEGFALWDANEKLILCNARFRDFNPLSADALVPGVPWLDFVRAGIEKGQYLQPLDTLEKWLARRADPSRLEFQQSDGRWYQAFTRPTRQGGRVLLRIDITERKEREAELNQAREVLEDAIESLPEGFALWDAHDKLILCNTRFREFNALSADVLVPGIPWLSFVRTGAERGQYVDAIGRMEQWLEERQRTLSPGAEFQQSDGRWYHSFLQSTRQGGLVAIRIDVTERKEMELALRESEELVRRVLEACPVPLRMTRAEDGKILYDNPATKALYGGPPAGGGESAIGYFADPVDRPPWLRALRERGAVDDHEVQLKRSDGTLFWASLSGRLIEYKGEEVIVGSTKDLTERLALEEEMARQREALTQSEKLSAMGELLAGVAHELNNPLSVVTGQALLLQEVVSDERIKDRAAKIGTAAERCARIVKTFLAMARQEPAESAAVDLNERIEAAIEVAGYSLRSADIDVDLHLAPELPFIQGDANQLGQVLTNLIVNAQHALEEKDSDRKLTISSIFVETSKRVVIEVKDNGPGIPAETQHRIFEPFFTTKEHGTGTGIGLALCHRIVVSHGGQIRAESTPGEGASFIFRLPVAAAGGEQTRTSAATEEAIEALSVLVIDDEPDVAELLGDILCADGHQVAIARSGSQALTEIERRDFDIILSDLRMPNLDGPGLYRILAERKRSLLDRVAFVTGDTMSPKARTFLESIDRPCLEKPVTPQAVRDLVRVLIRS